MVVVCFCWSVVCFVLSSVLVRLFLCLLVLRTPYSFKPTVVDGVIHLITYSVKYSSNPPFIVTEITSYLS